jgi:hypothetical protein
MRHSHDKVPEYGKASMPLWFIRSRNTTYYILGIIEALLAFRFLFKLLGANPENGFVAFMYSMAGIFASPFSGIFDPYVTGGLAAKSILEPSTLIAMAVYALLAWGLVGLFRLIAIKEGH